LNVAVSRQQRAEPGIQVLQLAAQIEKAEPWSKKRPPVYG